MSMDAFWTGLGLVIPFAIGAITAWYYYVKKGIKNILLREYRDIMTCETRDEQNYRGVVKAPVRGNRYDLVLREALFSICESLHCSRSDSQEEITPPEGFPIAHRMVNGSLLGKILGRSK